MYYIAYDRTHYDLYSKLLSLLTHTCNKTRISGYNIPVLEIYNINQSLVRRLVVPDNPNIHSDMVSLNQDNVILILDRHLL